MAEAWAAVTQYGSNVLAWTDAHAGAAGWFQGIGTIVAVYMAARIAGKQSKANFRQSISERTEVAKSQFEGFSAVLMEALWPFAKLEKIIKGKTPPNSKDIEFCLAEAVVCFQHVANYPLPAIPDYKINRSIMGIRTKLTSLHNSANALLKAYENPASEEVENAKEAFFRMIEVFDKSLTELTTRWNNYIDVRIAMIK